MWKRQLSNYVPQLQRSSKRASDSFCPLKVGSAVWIVDTDSLRGSYPLARVETLHYGVDGSIRSVTVKTESVSFVCPLTKFVPLPIFGSCDQEQGPGSSDQEVFSQ